MTAKEMFKELGYTQLEAGEELFGYTKYEKTQVISNIGRVIFEGAKYKDATIQTDILFQKEGYTVDSWVIYKDGTIEREDCCVIDTKLLEAMVQQSKELGWIKENE